MAIRIIVGDCLERMASVPDASVQCVITSPPYYGLQREGDTQMTASALRAAAEAEQNLATALILEGRSADAKAAYLRAADLYDQAGADAEMTGYIRECAAECMVGAQAPMPRPVRRAG